VLQFTGLGSLFLEPRLAYRWIRKALARVLSRMAADGRTHFIFQNPEDRDLLLTEGLKTPYGRLHLIEGNGIEARPPLERAVGGPDSVILLPARLLRQKGIFDFAAAITLLRAEGHSVRGVLAGGLDPQNPSALTESEIRGLAAQGTEWVGHQEDLRQWFASATAVCLPSAGEGLPRVLLEAAVDETPLIATRVPGCTSVVKDGVTGFLCEFGSPTDLARAIRQVLVDPTRARELGRAARQHVLTRFGKERILSEIVHVYTR
jgi:glycosyltransferase involved in cell wall biosynthesis